MPKKKFKGAFNKKSITASEYIPLLWQVCCKSTYFLLMTNTSRPYTLHAVKLSVIIADDEKDILPLNLRHRVASTITEICLLREALWKPIHYEQELVLLDRRIDR